VAPLVEATSSRRSPLKSPVAIAADTVKAALGGAGVAGSALL